jgi:hypothetical protein
MALKGGRKIVVRDREFRWKISGGKYHKEYGAPRRLHLVVQEAAEKPGTPLCVYLDSLRWIEGNEYQYETFGPRHKASVTPKDTRAVIEVSPAGPMEIQPIFSPYSAFILSTRS